MFPFIITLSKQLPQELGNLSDQDILLIINEKLLNDGVDKTELNSDNKLLIENKYFTVKKMNRPLMKVDKWMGIYRAKFEILSINNKRKIKYSIHLHIILFFGTLGGLFIGFVSHDWRPGLFAFLGLGVLNWIIATIRHGVFFKKLINSLPDEL